MHKMTIYSETMDKAEWSFQNIFNSPLCNGGSRKETDMRELPVVEGLRARITNETADQRPQKEGASLRLPFPPLYQLLSFHSTKTFVNVSSYKGSEISLNSFQKFWKLLNFRNANHSTEYARNSGSKVEWKENFREEVSEKFGYTSRGNFGKCCSIRYWKLPKIQTGSFGWMESALEISSDLIMI